MSFVKIKFLGDIALNDSYIEFYKKKINPFKKIQKVLSEPDFVIGNLECVSKGNCGENLLKKPRLSTTVETLNFLKILNLNLVSLANNHIYDHLEDGFIKTTNFLKKNNIKYLGASLKKERESSPLIITKNNVKLGFLNYVTKDTNPNLPERAKVFLNTFNLEHAIHKINLLKNKVDHIILLLHWGGRVEGGMFPDFNQPKIARKLIDAGVDLLIGHHSHTIQPYEIYKGKYIFYSLGNFCFSDYKFEGKNYINPKRRKNIIIPNLHFCKTGYSIKITYWKNNGDEIVFNPRYKLKMFIRNILFKTHRIRLIWKIYFVIHRKINPLYFYFFTNNISFYEKVKRLNWLKLKKYLKK